MSASVMHQITRTLFSVWSKAGGCWVPTGSGTRLARPWWPMVHGTAPSFRSFIAICQGSLLPTREWFGSCKVVPHHIPLLISRPHRPWVVSTQSRPGSPWLMVVEGRGEPSRAFMPTTPEHSGPDQAESVRLHTRCRYWNPYEDWAELRGQNQGLPLQRQGPHWKLQIREVHKNLSCFVFML